MIDDYSGCGTGIKWTFEGAKYQKGTRVVKDGIRGIIDVCYHCGSKESRGYIVKWENGNQEDIKETNIEDYVR